MKPKYTVKQVVFDRDDESAIVSKGTVAENLCGEGAKRFSALKEIEIVCWQKLIQMLKAMGQTGSDVKRQSLIDLALWFEDGAKIPAEQCAILNEDQDGTKAIVVLLQFDGVYKFFGAAIDCHCGKNCTNGWEYSPTLKQFKCQIESEVPA